MGLTHRSVGTHAAAFGGTRRAGERIVALAGNPNVGKSTVFNALTGMRQHTGNWAGKTVGCACGRCRSAREQYLLVDLPGTYSLQPTRRVSSARSCSRCRCTAQHRTRSCA